MRYRVDQAVQQFYSNRWCSSHSSYSSSRSDTGQQHPVTLTATFCRSYQFRGTKVASRWYQILSNHQLNILKLCVHITKFGYKTPVHLFCCCTDWSWLRSRVIWRWNSTRCLYSPGGSMWTLTPMIPTWSRSLRIWS